MPVDPKILEQCIAEAAGEDAEMATFLKERYIKNDVLAAKFVAGFMRSSDYTKKTQELAGQRQQYEQQSGQLDQVRKALEAAETEKNTILQDLAKHRVSTAKARELMKILQDKYQLTDEDLPGMSDLIETSKQRKPVDTTEDLDMRLKTFGDDLMSRMEKKFVASLTPELSAMANLPLVWADIAREHEELTGKRLTFSEQQEILKGARDANRSLRDVWEEKYQISGDAGLRMQKRDEGLKKSWQQEREAADAKKRQDDALQVVTPAQQDLGTGPNISAAFRNGPLGGRDHYHPPVPDQFGPNKDGTPPISVQPGQHVKQVGSRGPGAAQRAAQKYLEKGGAAGYGRKTA